MKQNVYLAQVNHLYGKNAFLPYSAGMLQAYAQRDPIVSANFEFQPIIFRREEIQRILARMWGKPPAVLGLSCYIWNYEYQMALARAVKTNFPKVLVIAGGPHIPVTPEKIENVDMKIAYEGELSFTKALQEIVSGEFIPVLREGNRIQDLDSLPSPYLDGVFDPILNDPDNAELNFHASQETHRGCPYSCTFCDWGSAVMTKLRKFSDERIMKELLWMADHKIEMVYNCDANYGIFPRDLELTRAMVDLKDLYGYPQKFRAAYAKNSNDVIFQHAKLLHDADMNKGVTLSFQSMDQKTLEIVKRDNIKITDFKRLMDKYREAGIATYSELILGLPGETYDTFANGLETMLECGQHESVQVYTCEVLPNSEMNEPEYKKLHGIETVRSPIPMFHGTPATDPYQEHYELVVATKTMPKSDWMRAQMFAWAVQALHCLGLTRLIAQGLRRLEDVPYRTFYERILHDSNPDGVLGKAIRFAADEYAKLRDGKPWGSFSVWHGDITWPPEEVGFLQLVDNKEKLYSELWEIVREFSTMDLDILNELFEYQEALVAEPHFRDHVTLILAHDWPAFFNGQVLCEEKTEVRISQRVVCHGDKEQFAREVVWYGRKGGTFMNRVRYVDQAT